jgi:hypothetical protein
MSLKLVTVHLSKIIGSSIGEFLSSLLASLSYSSVAFLLVAFLKLFLTYNGFGYLFGAKLIGRISTLF